MSSTEAVLIFDVTSSTANIRRANVGEPIDSQGRCLDSAPPAYANITNVDTFCYFGNFSICNHAMPSMVGLDTAQFVDDADRLAVGEPRKKFQCTYDLNERTAQFITLQAIKEAANTVGPQQVSDPKSSYNQVLRRIFCTQSVDDVDNCPQPDPLSGQKTVTCSRLSSKGPAGDECRQWCGLYTNQTTGNPCDTAKEDFCRKRDVPQEEGWIFADDCRCINRERDPIYSGSSPAFTPSAGPPINDNCWWKPCKRDNASFLVPEKIGLQPCPGNLQICQDVFNIAAESGGKININDIRNTIDCTDAGPTPGPSPPDPILSFIRRHPWIIAVAVVAIILIIVLIFRARRKK